MQYKKWFKHNTFQNGKIKTPYKFHWCFIQELFRKLFKNNENLQQFTYFGQQIWLFGSFFIHIFSYMYKLLYEPFYAKYLHISSARM